MIILSDINQTFCFLFVPFLVVAAAAVVRCQKFPYKILGAAFLSPFTFLFCYFIFWQNVYARRRQVYLSY